MSGSAATAPSTLQDFHNVAFWCLTWSSLILGPELFLLPSHDHHAILSQDNHSQEGVCGLSQGLRYPVALWGLHRASPE